jgi:hypothetical protein
LPALLLVQYGVTEWSTNHHNQFLFILQLVMAQQTEPGGSLGFSGRKGIDPYSMRNESSGTSEILILAHLWHVIFKKTKWAAILCIDKE